MELFVKLSGSLNVAICTFYKNGKMYLDHVFMKQTADELLTELKSRAGEYTSIRFDASMFINEAKEFRNLIINRGLDVDVVCYRSKTKLLNKITSSYEWINKFMVTRSTYISLEYSELINLFESYNFDSTEEKKLVVVSIVSDASIYYRRFDFENYDKNA